MKIVIQCAGRKRSDAGRLTDRTGTPSVFVAHPDKYDPFQFGVRRSRPDDVADSESGTWRDILVRYNATFVRDGSNPDRLLSAGDLYEPPVYGRLMHRFHPTNVFILSAGWGLVRADYLLPNYDITFSTQPKVRQECRRNKREVDWLDFNQLLGQVVDGEEIHFFGGQDYLDLFYFLSDPNIIIGKYVIHHKADLRHRAGYEYDRYNSYAKTNWHYLAADAFGKR